MNGRLFIETESFENLGGWVVDSQSMEQAGSAYVMAHGMGIPVADAETLSKCISPDQMGELVVKLCAMPDHLAVPDIAVQPMIQDINPM